MTCCFAIVALAAIVFAENAAFTDVVSDLSSVSSTVGSWGGDAAHNVSSKASPAWHKTRSWIDGAATDAANATGSWVDSAVNTVSSTAGPMVDSASDVIQSAANNISDEVASAARNNSNPSNSSAASFVMVSLAGVVAAVGLVVNFEPWMILCF